MADLNRVVAHYTDGTLLKGTTQDFHVNKPTFHLIPVSGSAGVEVHCRSLKALFFVKDFKGDPHSSAVKGFAGAKGSTSSGKKIAVLFHDGELMCGYTLAYVPGREGFFMFPADESSNNMRVFVVNAYVSEVRVGTDAEDLVQRVSEDGRRTAINV